MALDARFSSYGDYAQSALIDSFYGKIFSSDAPHKTALQVANAMRKLEALAKGTELARKRFG